MAVNTVGTFLMHKSGADTEYTKLIDVKETPDLGSDPEALETTDLSHSRGTNIPGIQTPDTLSFTANYTPADYAKVKALRGKEEDFAVWYGGTQNDDGTVTPTGADGKFSFKGYADVFVTGSSVNAVREMTVSILNSTPIDDSEVK